VPRRAAPFRRCSETQQSFGHERRFAYCHAPVLQEASASSAAARRAAGRAVRRATVGAALASALALLFGSLTTVGSPGRPSAAPIPAARCDGYGGPGRKRQLARGYESGRERAGRAARAFLQSWESTQEEATGADNRVEDR
jgi:hypothetical protein